ncbi:hypothetical protein A9G33_02110 [Gilliamella sp. Choc3-5]|jgi:hypothetical protein|uniref:hypothetical protein n=1 Tax=Gilliamella sp. Choc3-5 TaxID=3120236 RepID=UPI00077F6C7A|nr:hypothetical protein [Gilliamella apicola]OCG32931.1 hypothetical protein A9G33_02110 [Gilliamella apicola]
MNNNPSKVNAELIQEFRSMIALQIHGDMDWVRARTYWQNRLATVDNTNELAEVLSYALCKAAIRPK